MPKRCTKKGSRNTLVANLNLLKTTTGTRTNTPSRSSRSIIYNSRVAMISGYYSYALHRPHGHSQVHRAPQSQHPITTNGPFPV